MIDGYIGVKDRTYTTLTEGDESFGIRDQKGRTIGYRWKIERIQIELMTPEEYAACNGCSIQKIDAPTDYISLTTTPIRDGVSYGPAFNRATAASIKEAHAIINRRKANARKANTKKFAAFN